MDHGLAWAVIGLVLVIAELLTGTFYLVMLGVAAFGAAGAAYLGVDFSAQVQYVEAFANLAKTLNTLIVPATASDVAGFVATAMTVLDRAKDAKAQTT